MIEAYAIRKAKEADLGEILRIYAAAREFMASRGNPNQWGKTNPPKQRLLQDIAAGDLYVMVRDGILHGVFAFILGDDPTYGEIYEGSWLSDRPYGTIHRIAGIGSGGIFSACVGYCGGICAHLRVDTHENNLPMQRAIEREGFTRCGTIYIADGSPRIAYERV